jgi:hypothetical protein
MSPPDGVTKAFKPEALIPPRAFLFEEVMFETLLEMALKLYQPKNCGGLCKRG